MDRLEHIEMATGKQLTEAGLDSLISRPKGVALTCKRVRIRDILRYLFTNYNNFDQQDLANNRDSFTKNGTQIASSAISFNAYIIHKRYQPMKIDQSTINTLLKDLHCFTRYVNILR